jgi:hypothetical protein
MLQHETTITTININDDINNNQKMVFSTTRCQLDVPACDMRAAVQQARLHLILNISS